MWTTIYKFTQTPQATKQIPLCFTLGTSSFTIVKMSSISLHNISKVFPDGTQAVQEISLEIRAGEFLVLVGPSGCGKSTLLRLIAGLDELTGGSIKIGGENAASLLPKDRDLALVFQNYALFPNLSVYDNLAFGLKARKVSKVIIKEKIIPVSQRLGLEELLQRKPDELSGGQRQRVALGRLLVRNPSIHLLDEPLSNLDANLRTSMRHELAKLHNEYQKTTLFVTHDQVEAMTLGQRLCVMNQGRIIQVGTPTEIYDFPEHRFVAEFFGSPPINLFKGEIQSVQNNSFFTNGSIQIPLPKDSDLSEREIELGIRPEDWTVHNEAPSHSVSATLQRIENLGDTRILHFVAQENAIIAKSELREFQVGRQYFLTPHWNRVHWFDLQTEKRVLR